MPKAILKFNLPKENEEFGLAVNGSKYHSVLWDLDQHLRSKLKHGHEYKNTDEVLEDIRTKINEFCYAQDISLY